MYIMCTSVKVSFIEYHTNQQSLQCYFIIFLACLEFLEGVNLNSSIFFPLFFVNNHASHHMHMRKISELREQLRNLIMLMPTGLGVCSGASSTQVPSFLRDFSLIWLPLLNFFFLTLPATFDFFDFCLWLYYKDSSRSPSSPNLYSYTIHD